MLLSDKVGKVNYFLSSVDFKLLSYAELVLRVYFASLFQVIAVKNVSRCVQVNSKADESGVGPYITIV